MSGQNNRLLGRWGEALAADYLIHQGYRLVASSWSCRFGEIDLIVEDSDFLCFVEVKLRKSASHGRAGEFVDFHKQNRLRTTAELYLAQHPTTRQPRFDVVEIYAPDGMHTGAPEIIFHKNAFY